MVLPGPVSPESVAERSVGETLDAYDIVFDLLLSELSESLAECLLLLEPFERFCCEVDESDSESSLPLWLAAKAQRKIANDATKFEKIFIERQ